MSHPKKINFIKLCKWDIFQQPDWTNIYPPVSKASREVANLTEIKKLHTPVYGVKEFVCLSVCGHVRKKKYSHNGLRSQGD